MTRFSPDGKLLSALLENWSVSLLDPGSSAEYAVLEPPVPHRPSIGRFSPDGRLLVIASRPGDIMIWDLDAIERGLRDAGLDLGLELPLPFTSLPGEG